LIHRVSIFAFCQKFPLSPIGYINSARLPRATHPHSPCQITVTLFCVGVGSGKLSDISPVRIVRIKQWNLNATI
jgi:hypothetical protein